MIDFGRFRKAIDRKNAAAFTLERTRARATKITTTITGQPRGSSTGKQVEDGVIQIMQAEEALQARRVELQVFKDALEAEMGKLADERQEKFMRCRYLEEISVPNIAIKESYSESTVYEEIRKAEKLINRAR
ncbi:MAG: hypothetical protein IKG87_07770 [Clostridia bacterium]|nr:hypothetical protein [Clostridia bacterium]MBR3429977.1 hypothetical protein [Clostridia bacterium]